MPPLLAHRITDFQNIDSGTLFRPESDHGHGGVPEDVQFWDFTFDAVDNLSSGGNDILC